MAEHVASPVTVERRRRVDAQRNLDSVIAAAKAVFAESGVDAPIREVAAAAGVGVGTVYRHFPQRADLVIAVFQHEVDAAADAAPGLAEAHPPLDALILWLQRYTEFVAAKRGLSTALHSGDPAFDALPAYFTDRLGSALGTLLDAAEDAGAIRRGVDAEDLLSAVSRLCSTDRPGDTGETGRRMVALLVDGLRFGADGPAN